LRLEWLSPGFLITKIRDIESNKVSGRFLLFCPAFGMQNNKILHRIDIEIK
jgi:hypothetical protein